MSRTIVVWCPDWPLVAAGLAGEPSAVLRANRVVACSRPARDEGVRLRQRRREAEAACSGLVFLKEDPGGAMRAFEVVLAAVARFTPHVEITRPGVCSLPARGPARYFGGEEVLAGLLTRAATEAASAECRVGIADTPFAARLAARQSLLVPSAETAGWLAGLPITVLGSAQVSDLLIRLGIAHVGEFAKMEEAVVSARFGAEGARVHRLARGLSDERLLLGDPPPDLSVEQELEDPVDNVETIAFITAGLADELSSRLAAGGLACTLLRVEASTEHGEELSRHWRADRPFTSRAMVDRMRWQLEGWLAAPKGAPTGGVTLVRLTAGEVVPDTGHQLGFLGDPVDVSKRVERGVARIQGLLGHEAIGTAVRAGGRGPGDQVRYITWGEPREEGPEIAQPWPGRLPAPAPNVVYESPLEVTLRDEQGSPVGVTGRGQCTAEPVRLFVRPGRELRVTSWAGPWPVEERWWDPAAERRRARLQVLLEDGSAHLLALEGGRWGVEASYD
ncbi:MAG: DNA polymerase Y family protein [Acidimicrobiales bacterium]